jgi:hypothetical protein
MQAKSSVSDYHGSGKLSWVPHRPAAESGRDKPKLMVVDSKSQTAKLKPGLY